MRISPAPLVLVALLAAMARGQTPFDSSWFFSVGGQRVQADADGSFFLANVPVIDSFGLAGSESTPDHVSDDFMRVVGFSNQNGTARYAVSTPFRLVRWERLVVPEFTVTDRPPLSNVELTLTASRTLLKPTETVQLTANAILSDGSQADVTPASAYTLYRTSNAATVTVSPDGLVMARARGRGFVTATNLGATSVKAIDVVTEIVPTIFVGFCVALDGSPIGGAQVWTSLGGSAMSASDGSFSFPLDVSPQLPVSVFAYLKVSGSELTARSRPIKVTGERYTDAGVLVLRPRFDGHLYDIPTVHWDPTYVLVPDGASADLDRDGDLDLVVAKSELGTDVLLNRGKGTFDPPVTYATGGPSNATRFVRLGDLDGDNDVDVVDGNHDNAVGSVIHVLRNRSDGSFDQAGQLTIGTAAITDLELADLDGDGDLDLALHLLTESFVRVLKNQGDGSFVAAGTYASGGATDRLATGDVDGDGDQDVVAINYFFNPPESELAVLLNDGQGAFAAPKTYAVGGAVRDLVLSDVDRDSDLDAAIAVTDLGRMSIMKNLGGGVFGGKVDYAIGMSPFVVTAADLDADGDDDLASVGVGTDLTDLVVLRNQGTGSFAIEGYPVGQSGEVPNAIIARDIDREHGVDLLVVTDTGAHLQRNQGDGIFVRLTYFVPDTRLQAGKAADLDRDGDQDVIASPYNDDSLLVLHNDGHGTFTKVQEQTVNGTDLRLALADLNRDGDVDCVAKVRTTREVAVLLNRGDGTLDDPASYVTGRGLADIALGDLDGDGDVDVVTAHSESTPPTLKAVGVLHNLGDGTLAGESLVWSANSGVIRVVLGDLDLDGDLDIIASQDGAFAWLRNDGQGNFPSVALIPTLRYLSALTIADVDRDPYPDVIAVGADTNPGNWATVHLNHGDETFGRSDYPAKLPSDVTVADVDNDLNLDLIVSGPDEVSVFFNAGDGTFGLEHLFGALEYCRSTMTGDFDGDGLMDAAAVGGSNVVGYAKGLWLLRRREDVR